MIMSAHSDARARGMRAVWKIKSLCRLRRVRCIRWRMTKPPLTTPAERIAFFQNWFSDTIPHNKALGLQVVDVRRGFASMRLEWREELVGNPETGVLAGGPLTAM